MLRTNQLEKSLVSVLMPAYNAERYIALAIESILDQTFQDWELIIIDDCSTDQTFTLASSYSCPKINVYRNDRNSGPSATVNRAISLSNGDYVGIMHADDIAVKTRLEKQVEFLQRNVDIDILGAQYQILNDNDSIPPDQKSKLPVQNESIRYSLLFNNPFCHPAMMIRRNVFDQLLYNTAFRLCEDYEFWIRSAIAGKKMANLAETAIYYRRHSAQASAVRSEEEAQVFNEIRDNYRQHFKNIPFKEIDSVDPARAVGVINFIKTHCKDAIGRRILISQFNMNLHRLIKQCNSANTFSLTEYLRLLHAEGYASFNIAILYQVIKKKLSTIKKLKPFL